MKRINQLLFAFLLFELTACSTLNTSLKAGPIENTAFANHVLEEVGKNIALTSAHEAPFQRSWRTEAELCLPEEPMSVYVAPVDTSAIVESTKGLLNARPGDAKEIADYLHSQVETQLQSD